MQVVGVFEAPGDLVELEANIAVEMASIDREHVS